MKLGEIARKLNCTLRGPADLEINGVCGIEEARKKDLTFVSNPRYLSKIKSTRAGAIILAPEAPTSSMPTLVSENPYLTFAQAVELFYSSPEPIAGIHPTATIADSAVLGEHYSIGANVVIGEEVRISNHVVLYPNVTIYPYAEIGDHFIAHSNSVVREYCKIGDRVILQNGAVVGGDGFGFAPKADGTYYKIVQSGITVLEDDVEIGAHACVDRATVGETRVGRGTKIDNLVQIGHGCQVGKDTVLASQVGLAGTTRVGNRVKLGGQVGVSQHLTIGDGVVAVPQTGIARSVKAGKMISGSPEMDVSLWKKNYLLMRDFPDLVRKIRRMEKEIEELRKKLIGIIDKES